jgi:hypothetical protein
VIQWRAGQRILWPTPQEKGVNVRVEKLKEDIPPPPSPLLFRDVSATGVAEFPHSYPQLTLNTKSFDAKKPVEPTHTPTHQKTLEAAQMMALLVRC